VIGDPRYKALGFTSRAETLRAIASGDERRAIAAVLGAAEESPNFDWVEAAAIALTLSNLQGVQRSGLLALSTLIRRFGAGVDLSSLVTVLDRLQSVPGLEGVVADVRDDIEVFGV
jgi:hypothetical protein